MTADKCLFVFSILRMGNLARHTRVRLQQLPEQHYPFLPIRCAVFLCVQTMVWMLAFGIFNMRTDVDASNCAGGLCEHSNTNRVCTENSMCLFFLVWGSNRLSYTTIFLPLKCFHRSCVML